MADGYTPTTEDVRDVYGHFDPELFGQFDRWLAVHDAEVSRAAAEKAWDEGRDSRPLTSTGLRPPTTNPYRKDT